jgi:hypothetical protein
MVRKARSRINWQPVVKGLWASSGRGAQVRADEATRGKRGAEEGWVGTSACVELVAFVDRCVVLDNGLFAGLTVIG